VATILFNGKSYNRVEDMPPEARQAYEQAMGPLADNNQDGLPAGGQTTGATRMQFSTDFSPGAPIAPTPPILPAVTSQPEDTDRLRQMVIGGALIVLLVLVSGLVAALLYLWLYAAPR
jgi:hypothetical protein